MSTGQILLLGALAGVTIFIGLPMGRVQGISQDVKAFLSATATGIGLHNFSEGLAIGQAAATDKISLAYVLVIGFGLHNATEGFGIVAPLSGDAEKPSWRFLALLGVIGGAPTFFGTVVGQAWTSTAVSVLFLTLAAGSILYVVMELLNVCRLFSSKTVTAWGLILGLTLGFATDFVLVAAGV